MILFCGLSLSVTACDPAKTAPDIPTPLQPLGGVGVNGSEQGRVIQPSPGRMAIPKDMMPSYAGRASTSNPSQSGGTVTAGQATTAGIPAGGDTIGGHNAGGLSLSGGSSMGGDRTKPTMAGGAMAGGAVAGGAVLAVLWRVL